MSGPQAYNWKIGGVGGAGLQSASNLLGRTLVRAGYAVHVYDEYPSIIKGGQAASQVLISPQLIRSHRNRIHCLVAFDEAAIRRYQEDLHDGGLLLYDRDAVPSA